MLSLSLLVLIILSFPLILLFFLHNHKKTIHNLNLPPCPKGLPILGNLHQLNNSSLHIDLSNLSKKYGPLLSLKLGHRTVLIVSSPKMAKETIKDHDIVFSDRPSFYSQQKLSYNGKDITFSPYGNYWREIRKICAIHVFGNKHVSSVSSIRRDELYRMIQKISRHSASSKVTNLNEVLMSLTTNIICRVAFGQSYEEEGAEKSRFHGMVNEMMTLMGTFFMSDYINLTGWMDKITGLNSRLERIFKEMDAFLQQVINEHMDPQRLKPHEEEEQDLVDVFLHLKNQRSFSVDITFDHLKAILMDFLVAGTDTAASVIVWAMTQLMKNPKVMHKVQEEVRKLCGKKGFIEEKDIQKLTYLKAVVKETLRLHPPAPLLGPKQTSEKCVIAGFEIPAKTTVYVNAWAIHRDPEAWKNPKEFYPERFLEKNLDFKGQDMEFIPFGAGRRICPGLLMGAATVELAVANLVYAFEWEMPTGSKREDIDVEEVFGLVSRKKNSLCLVAKSPLSKF